MDENENKNIEVVASEVQSNTQVHSEPKGLYITSLILGICAIVFGWIPIFGQILAVVALIIGIVAMLKMKKCNSKNGMVIAGLVMSIIGFILGIVITVIIILTGVVIYDKASEAIEESDLDMHRVASNVIESAADDFSEAERDMYNSTFEAYEGNSETGTSVRRLIDEIISSNEDYAGDDEKFVSIETDDITGFDDDTLDDACEKANPYEGGNNSVKNVDAATTEMNELSSKIMNSKKYTVDMVYSDGFVVEVKISEQ